MSKGRRGLGVSKSLKAARYVARTEPTNEEMRLETGLVRLYRELKETKPAEFLRALEKMEGEYAVANQRHLDMMPKKRAELDSGSAACVALAEKLIEELTGAAQ